MIIRMTRTALVNLCQHNNGKDVEKTRELLWGRRFRVQVVDNHPEEKTTTMMFFGSWFAEIQDNCWTRVVGNPAEFGLAHKN